jgi:hypothetical protein
VARSTTFKYTVTVVSDSGNKYAIDGNTQQYVVLFPGCTYEFNQDDSSNATHPLRFSETSDGTHNSGSEYTTGVTTSGTPGSATAFTKIEVTSSTPVILYYYCSSHSGMGGNVDLVTTQTSAGNRFLSCGGNEAPAELTQIDYTNMTTQGNAYDFGDLNTKKGKNPGSAGTAIKFFVFGGSAPAETNSIEFGIMAGTGTTTDYGDLQSTKQSLSGLGNSTRALSLGGYDAPARTDVIGYFSTTSAGNAADFGNLTIGRSTPTGFASSTRGVCAGGYASPGTSNVIDYVTISSTGNATDFGDLGQARYSALSNSACSSVRGLIAGGATAPDGSASNVNTITYVTIASTSGDTDFGDLTVARSDGSAGSNNLRACFAGGLTPSASNVIDYVMIATTGDAIDFGDLVTARGNLAGASSNHGGLQ